MHNKLTFLLATLILFSAGWMAAAGAETASSPAANAVAGPLPSAHLQNLFHVTTNIFSGDAPEGDDAFAEIAKLGVKTLISVDGTKPDVETAHKHGLRYIHLPFGYNGIPASRIADLTKAAQSVVGPMYVH